MKRKGSSRESQEGWSLETEGLWGVGVPVVMGMKDVPCPIGLELATGNGEGQPDRKERHEGAERETGPQRN